MALLRYIGLIDLGVLTVIAVALFLPAREMYAQSAFKGDPHAIALAEALTIARPGDGEAIEDFTRRLGEADMKDWAIEASVRLSAGATSSPTRWRALIAASVAYIEKVDVVPALDYANRAIAACLSAREQGHADACRSSDEIRMRLYQQNLDAGVKSGIDPRVDPKRFREAGQAALRVIRIGPGQPPASGSDADRSGKPAP